MINEAKVKVKYSYHVIFKNLDYSYWGALTSERNKERKYLITSVTWQIKTILV